MGVRDDVVPTLERSPLFAGHSRKQIEKALVDFDEQTFMAGNRIVSEGRTGPDFFIILEGEAEVVDAHDDRVVARLGAGDFFGEIAALDEGPRTRSVRATTQLRALGLPNGTFRQFLVEHPTFTINMMQAIVRRFRAVVTSADQKVAGS